MSNSRIIAAATLAVAYFTLWHSATVFADGPFDPMFGHAGLYLYTPGEYAEPYGIAQDDLGQLLVVTTLEQQLAVTRHKPDGSLDESFGDNGVASDFISVDSASRAWATSIAMDHHGRILLGGGSEGLESCSSGGSGLVDDFLVIRVENGPVGSGLPDSTFGTFGVGSYGGCSHPTNGIAGLAVGADDSVFAVGMGIDRPYRAVAVKWNADGRIATDFGTDGSAAYRSITAEQTAATSAAVDTSGRLLVTTQSYGMGVQTGALVRFTSDGELDTSFGTSGAFDLGTLSPDIRLGIGSLCCVRADGQNRALVAGLTVSRRSDGGADTRAFVARFTGKGIPDESFGLHGFAIIGDGEFYAINALSVDDRGRPVVAGASKSPYAAVPAVVVVQLNADGRLNKSVGFGGIFGAEYGFNSYSTSLLVGKDGGIVVGAAENYQPSTLIRYDQVFGDGLD